MTKRGKSPKKRAIIKKRKPGVKTASTYCANSVRRHPIKTTVVSGGAWIPGPVPKDTDPDSD